MNPLFRTFKTDPELERQGVFIDYGPNSKGRNMRIRLARAGGANEEYAKLLEQVTRPYRKAIQAGSLPKDVVEDLYLDVFARAVVKGLENFEDKDGADLPFTVDSVKYLAKELPDLYADWQEQANRLAVFREEVLEADVGNSGQS